MDPDIRWKQRFQNLDRAVSLLDDALKDGEESLSQLEKDGVIQRFEYTFELAWKTVKDYLFESGLVITPVTPRNVLKEAYAANVLSDGQVWIDMLEHRNLLSHTYDDAVFSDTVRAIEQRYLPAMKLLHGFFLKEAAQ